MTKRYDLEDTEAGATELVERSHGDWVSFEDYDALVEERDLLRKIVNEALSLLNAA